MEPENRITASCATLLLALAAPLAAQVGFRELNQELIRFAAGPTESVALADVDGDGDLDLFTANAKYQNQGDPQDRLYLNDGKGRFTEVTTSSLPVNRSSSGAAEFGDVDGDRDQDLVVAIAGRSRLFVNDGRGRFSDASAQLPASGSFAVRHALVDLDGDRDLDLVVLNLGRQDQLFLNDGLGRFSEVTSTHMPVDTDRSSALAAGDVDGDGDMDLLIASALGVNRLYLNDGRGRFAIALGVVSVNRNFGVALADLDGDGDRDAVWSGSNGAQITWNDGRGRFTAATATGVEVVLSGEPVAARDLDGDGDMDLVFGTFTDNWLFHNDGRGRFTQVALPRDVDYTRSLALGDIDGDGDADLFCGNLKGSNRLYHNDGRGVLQSTDVSRAPAGGASDLAIGDVDGDGDQDVFTATGNRQSADALHVNDGNAHFAVQWMPGSNSFCCAFGDADGDGDLDLFAGENTRLAHYLNDGTGRFTDASARIRGGSGPFLEILVVDVDRDNDVDLLVRVSAGVRLYLNQLGTFTDVTATHLPVSGPAPACIATGDVDGDGDPDLIEGNVTGSGGLVRLYLNDGRGRFADATAQRMPGVRAYTHAVALGDLDGDGDLDIVAGNVADPAYPSSGLDGFNRVYTNDGTGRFAVTATLSSDRSSTRLAVLGDVDEDGDLDVVFGHFQALHELYVNDGRGRFVLSPALPRDLDQTTVIALRDLDQDGDLDLLAADNLASANRLYFNLLRQVAAPLTPYLGASYQLQFFAEGGFAAAPRAIHAFASLAPLQPRFPLPFGLLGIDLTAAVGPLVLQTAAPSGLAAVTITVPNLPILAGQTLHTQALVRHGGSRGDRLSNVQADRIQR